MNGPIVHGGGLAAAAAEFGGEQHDWLDLSTGLNPTPPALPAIPPAAWHRLPDKDLVDGARKAAQQHYRSGAILPLPVPGTQSVIQLLPFLVARPGRAAVLWPTYGEYEHVLVKAGFGVERINDLQRLRDDHDLVVVVNPNNPDGRLLDIDLLLDLHARVAARGGLLVVDEAFADVAPQISLAPFASSLPNLLIFRSFGKFFGLAGLRLGFVIGADAILDKLADKLGPWAVSGPALYAASRMLPADPAPVREGLAARRAGLQAVLREAGLKVAGGTDLFCLVDEPEAWQLHRHLCRFHILTRRFDYASSWLRFGLTPDTHSDQRLLVALRSFRA